MLNRIVITNKFKPESLHAVRHEGVITNLIPSQAFLFGENNMSKRFIRKDGAPLCACGCGERITNKSSHYKGWCKYIKGHNRKGIKLSDETIKKLSGKSLSIERKRQISKSLKKYFQNNPNPFKDKIHSKKTKEIMSKLKKGIPLSEEHRKNILNSALKGKDHPMYGKCGPLAPNWQGGITTEPYCDIWLDEEYKQSIRDRDNNECQNPDCRNNCNHLPLNIHHINYIKKDCNPWNLISLCISCNFRANYNRENWQLFYQNIMFEKYEYLYA